MAERWGDSEVENSEDEAMHDWPFSRMEDSLHDSGCESISSPRRPSTSSGSVDDLPTPGTSKSLKGTKSKVEDMSNTGLWVFGYGSLCWHQGFEFSESMTGFVHGFSRRFWQGNTTHRGTDDKPGRVATLVEDNEGLVWGQAFKVVGEAALPYLNNRECELGGYRTSLTTFHPRDSSFPPFPVILYVATPYNRHWLGESPLPTIADQILDCAGNSGHNVEYLLRLAEFVRETVPEATDDHLFGLEALVLDQVVKRKLCLSTLMGVTPKKSLPAGPAAAEQPGDLAAAPSPRPQFSSRVPKECLRCVNI